MLGIVIATVLLSSIVWVANISTLPVAFAQYGQPSGNIFPNSGPLQLSPSPTTPSLTTTTDPELQRFDQIVFGCNATVQRMYPGIQTAQDVFLEAPQQSPTLAEDFAQMTQCNQLLRQAIAQYCTLFQTYDATKCAYVNNPKVTNLIDMTAIIAQQEFLYGPSGLSPSIPR